MVVLGDVGEQLQHRDGRGDQVVEVEGVGATQPALVVRVRLRQGLLLVVAGLLRERLVVDELVLQVRHLVAERARRVALGVEVEVAADQGHEALGVEGVVDRERRRHPQARRLLAQDAHAGRVEGRHPHRARSRADELDDALAHLARGLVRERDREDLAGARVAGREQVGDAPGEDPGLPRPGAGHDEQRAAAVLDGRTLLGVEVVDERREGVGP